MTTILKKKVKAYNTVVNSLINLENSMGFIEIKFTIVNEVLYLLRTCITSMTLCRNYEKF